MAGRQVPVHRIHTNFYACLYTLGTLGLFQCLLLFAIRHLGPTKVCLKFHYFSTPGTWDHFGFLRTRTPRQPLSRLRRLPVLLYRGKRTHHSNIDFHSQNDTTSTHTTQSPSSHFRLVPFPPVCGRCCCCYWFCCRDSILKCIFHFPSSYMRVSFFVCPAHPLPPRSSFRLVTCSYGELQHPLQ